MCIFHVQTVRGLPGSEGASTPCMGLPGNVEAPLAMRLLIAKVFCFVYTKESISIARNFAHETILSYCLPPQCKISSPYLPGMPFWPPRPFQLASWTVERRVSC